MKKSLLRHVAIVALVATIAGCTNIPKQAENLQQTVEAPSRWSSLAEIPTAQTAGALPLNWVKSFSDDALDSLILEALNNNNDLGATAARIRVAKQGFRATLGGALPQLNANVRGNQDDENRFFSTGRDPDAANPAGNIFQTRDTYLGSLNAQWEVDVWGRLSDAARGAYRDTTSAKADYDAARLSLAANVTIGWYNLVSARLQRELAERDVASGQANLRITERRYERGVSASLDVRLARSSLATSKASLIARQQTEKEANRSLEVLLGRYPAAELAAAETLPILASLTNAQGQVVGLGNPQSLLDRRPDILAAENRLVAEGLRERQARKAFLPSFQISGAGSIRSAQLSDLFDADTIIANIAGALTQTLFAGGRLDAQRKRQSALAEQAAYNYVNTVLNAFREVENAITAESLLSAREEALQLAFEEARASEKLTERQYVSGTRNIFNLINAQQTRIQRESQFIAAQQQRLNNRVNLYLALGGTFDVGTEKFNSNGKEARESKTNLPLFNRWWKQATTKPDKTKTAGTDT